MLLNFYDAFWTSVYEVLKEVLEQLVVFSLLASVLEELRVVLSRCDDWASVLNG